MRQFRDGTVGSCPHCGVTVRFEAARAAVNRTAVSGLFVDGGPSIACCRCPSCRQNIVSLSVGEREWAVWPPVPNRSPIHPDVPTEIKNDFEEAALVLPWSPKASAALSRRCLQAILISRGASKGKSLYRQIDELQHTYPSYVSTYVDNVRRLGNIAAHPEEDVTGQVLDVEDDEAEWMLELLEALFDHYFAKPAEAAAKAAKLKGKIGT